MIFVDKMWILSFRNLKLPTQGFEALNNTRYLSNKSAWITAVKRKLYLRKYPTLLVQPDGSTLTIRHFEPRRIIKLPLDISTVSDELREEILEKRKPKEKVIIEEEIEDDFDSGQYIELIKKQRSSN